MHLHRAVQAFTAAVNLGPCVLLVDGIDLLTETLGLSKQEVIFQSPVAFNFLFQYNKQLISVFCFLGKGTAMAARCSAFLL